MKVKRKGITENLRRIWLFSADKIKSSESFNKQPTQLNVELNFSLGNIIIDCHLWHKDHKNIFHLSFHLAHSQFDPQIVLIFNLELCTAFPFEKE